MVDDIKNIVLAGIGSAAYTYEKATKLVDTMVEKGKLTIDEGKDLSQELKKTFKDKTKATANKVQSTADKVKPLTKEDMKELLSEMNFATKDEIAELKQRISILENK